MAEAPVSDPPERAPWTLAEVETATTGLLGKQGPFRPSVRLLERNGRRFVAKDYRVCSAPYRWTVGAFNLRRERNALGRLDGLPGIPRIEAEVGRWIQVLTWFPGEDLGRTPKDRQTPAFFDALLDVVRRMHERGVVHLDLRQRRNVLVTPDGEPAVIDFGASLCLSPGGRLLRWLARIDTSGVLKYKQRANPGSLTPDEERLLRSIERRRRLWPFG